MSWEEMNIWEALDAEGVSPEEKEALIKRFENVGVDFSTLRFESRDGVFGIAVDTPEVKG